VGVTLSIVIPTLGRPSLERTLESCAGADEVIVVLDTARGTTELPCRLPENARLAVTDSFGVTGGHAGRVAGINLATGTHLAFMDDDDIYTPGAIETIRAAACDRPVIFRIDHYAHGNLWRDPEIRFGNVSTQMYLVPNDPARLGSWTPHVPGLPEPGGDYTFIKETCEQMGEPVWREEIIARLRPDRGPTIAVVTPWHNHLELADAYMEAMEAGPYPDELIVVDNASDPPLDFAAVRLEQNRGFSGGSNAGLKAATAEIVAFVNNDITLGQPGWLKTLCARVETDVLVGAVLRNDAHAWVDGEHVPYLDGWCLAGMRDDLLWLGGFDETLAEPAYYSDNLLCLEARAAGFQLREEPRVALQHLCNGSIGPEDRERQRAASRANRERYVARVRELLVPSPEGVGATR
jgi:glycosyltransferase involved in cell wall biosynthesis